MSALNISQVCTKIFGNYIYLGFLDFGMDFLP